ncbi:hypothetical protein BGZ95_000604 [Linnemannia exigua]|uniref:Uncharacterized protein n=1 Tax=Linnemannia exigua TaxID=604196 RepID=A0AAD4H9X6_9FUNG|nr:hypothetical protein BGZ95_000604 [Linnemannia exigua]
MKTQLLSLLLIGTVVLADIPDTLANSPHILRADPLAQGHPKRRTLIGSHVSYLTQVDNSDGKHVFRVDHNGDSSIRKGGLLYDIQRRGLLNHLAGNDETSIENINDNSSDAQAMNSQGNTHTTTTTRIHREPSPDAERWFRQHGFINRRSDSIKDSEEAPRQLDRRGLLWGGSSTTISNVNDNSQHTNTFNSHGNRSKKITKVVSTNGDRGSHGHRDDGQGRDDDLADSWFDKRADEMLDHSQSHNRRALYKVEHLLDMPQQQPQHQEQGQGDHGSSSVDRRATTLTTTTAIVQFDDGNNNDDKDESKKVDTIARRNLVTIQIVTQNTNTNTNGHTIDNSRNNNNIYPVKVIHSSKDDGGNKNKNKKKRNKKKKEEGSSPTRRPHPASKNRKFNNREMKKPNPPKHNKLSKPNNRPIPSKYNQPRPREAMHATRYTKKINNQHPSRRMKVSKQKQ